MTSLDLNSFLEVLSPSAVMFSDTVWILREWNSGYNFIKICNSIGCEHRGLTRNLCSAPVGMLVDLFRTCCLDWKPAISTETVLQTASPRRRMKTSQRERTCIWFQNFDSLHPWLYLIDVMTEVNQLCSSILGVQGEVKYFLMPFPICRGSCRLGYY